MRHLDRRRFLQTATAALAAGVAGPGCAVFSRGKNMAASLPIVDTHQHLWDLEKLPPPWIADAPEVLRRSYVSKDYLEATRKLNIARAVYMEVDVSPDRQSEEALHVIELAKSNATPTAAAVISGRPASPLFEEYIRRFAESPYIKGVRQVLQVPEARRGLCMDPEFVRSIELLGELDLSFDLCMRPRELTDGLSLVTRCPNTRFILDHCGNADPKAFRRPHARGLDEPWHDAEQWKHDMSALAEQDNVTCKISGIIARAPKDDWTSDDLAPIINHCLDEFGPDRVVFGSDWPVCNIVASYAHWVDALGEVISNRRLGDQKKLLAGNALRIYGL